VFAFEAVFVFVAMVAFAALAAVVSVCVGCFGEWDLGLEGESEKRKN
jgi:hypothetical protein